MPRKPLETPQYQSRPLASVDLLPHIVLAGLPRARIRGVLSFFFFFFRSGEEFGPVAAFELLRWGWGEEGGVGRRRHCVDGGLGRWGKFGAGGEGFRRKEEGDGCRRERYEWMRGEGRLGIVWEMMSQRRRYCRIKMLLDHLIYIGDRYPFQVVFCPALASHVENRCANVRNYPACRTFQPCVRRSALRYIKSCTRQDFHAKVRITPCVNGRPDDALGAASELRLVKASIWGSLPLSRDQFTQSQESNSRVPRCVVAFRK